MGIIEAKDLVHEYIIRDEEGNVESIRTALDHMDLSVEAGQFIAVLGHNGSGKSTFAKHLNALLTPSEGTLIVDGMDVSDESLTYDIRQEAGMVFQNPDNQIIASVVQEDVGFGPENIGVPTEEIWERVEKSLKAVGMWQYREHSPNKLSGGQAACGDRRSYGDGAKVYHFGRAYCYAGSEWTKGSFGGCACAQP